MHHPRYCPTQTPEFSTNITNYIHFSAPPTLAHYPPYPRWYTTHATHVNTLPTPPTLAWHPRNLTAHAGTNCTPYLKLFSNVYQIVTDNFLKENLSSRNLPIENLPPDNNVHEEISPYVTYPQKFAPKLAELFISTLSILPKCAFSKNRAKKFNSSVLVSNFTVLMNLACNLTSHYTWEKSNFATQ